MEVNETKFLIILESSWNVSEIIPWTYQPKMHWCACISAGWSPALREGQCHHHWNTNDRAWTGFPQTSLEKFQWIFNEFSRQKSQISMIILNVTKWKNTGPHVTHGLLKFHDHYWVFFRKFCNVFLLYLMNNKSVNNAYRYVKYI